MDPGISDENVLQIANDEQRKLLTADKDFGELVYRQRLVMNRVTLIRLSGLPPERKAQVLLQAIEDPVEDLSPEIFAVITPGTLRIRKPT